MRAFDLKAYQVWRSAENRKGPWPILVDIRWTSFANAKDHPEGWPLQVLILHRKIGAGEGIRTLDPNLGKVMLYP
jgi:hypothetical protein